MSYQMEVPQEEHEILHLFLSIALGGNSFLHPYIDDSFRKNEWEYYEAYQRSGLKGNPLFSMYTTKSEERIRQAAGMVEWCYQNQQFTQLDQLIKKGYKFAFQYLQQHPYIDFEHFMRNFAKRQKGKTIKEIELIYHNIVLWYLSVRENKYIHTQNVAWRSFQEVLKTSLDESRVQKVMFSRSMLDKRKEEIDVLYKEYNIPKSIPFDSLSGFFEYLISYHLKKIQQINPDCSTEMAEQQVFQISPTKYIGAMGGWLKTLNVHELDATEQLPLTKEDLDMVFLEVLYARKYNYITKDDQDLFFIACLYQKCLSTLYRDTKQLYLDDSKQAFYLSLKAKESQITEQVTHLKQSQQEWQCTYKRQQKEIEGLTRDLHEANAKIRQLEQNIKNLDDYSDEVHALRNFVYREDMTDSDLEKTPSLKVMTEFIQSKRIMIFGGTLNWQQKLKEVFPAVEFVEADERNRDISRIQKADAVFINTTVFGHAFYKKIMKELSKSETPLFYLNGISNIEKTILEIYNWLKD